MAQTDDLDEREPEPDKCPCCGGTGLEWEGWDCFYCDGFGYLDF